MCNSLYKEMEGKMKKKFSIVMISFFMVVIILSGKSFVAQASTNPKGVFAAKFIKSQVFDTLHYNLNSYPYDYSYGSGNAGSNVFTATQLSTGVSINLVANEKLKTATFQKYANNLLASKSGGMKASVYYSNRQYNDEFYEGSIKQVKLTANKTKYPELKEKKPNKISKEITNTSITSENKDIKEESNLKVPQVIDKIKERPINENLAIVTYTKKLAENLAYPDISQEIVKSEKDILNKLIELIKSAINDDDVMVKINTISYNEPISGSIENLRGTDGYYNFTVTTSKNGESDTTSEMRVIIEARSYFTLGVVIALLLFFISSVFIYYMWVFKRKYERF